MSKGTAIIVGVGPGLGLALGRVFAREGHDVALLARSAQKVNGYAAQIATWGVEARGYSVDVSDSAGLQRTMATALRDLGAPEVLVYNAAVLREDTPTDGDHAGWANALAVDVLGAKVAAETVLPEFVDNRGSVLFTGGGLALAPSPEFASLSVGKAALRAYASALHAQLRGTGIHVASVTIAGDIGGSEERFSPDSIASRYFELHTQPEDEWTDELLID